MSEGSISLNPTPLKYYWVQYTLPGGLIADKCISQHPFHFIHNKNLDPVTKSWAKVRLINWKEINKEDFYIWLAVNPATESENELQIFDIRDMD